MGNIKEQVMKILEEYSEFKANLSSEALREQLTNDILNKIGVTNET